MSKRTILSLVCLLAVLIPDGYAFANTDSDNPWDRVQFPSDSPQQDDEPERRSSSSSRVLRDLGELTGNDRPDLRDDARDFRNLTGITATAVEEFSGVDTSRYVGYLDLFLNLFRRRNRDKRTDELGQQNESEDGIIAGQEGQDDLLSGGEDSLEASDVVGAAGAINPVLAQQSLADRAFTGEGGGPLGFNPQILRTSLTASELLNLQREQLALQLGEEGQALTAAKAQESTTAMEAVNTVADEIQGLEATQDVNKLAAKQRSLMAVLAQGQFSEQQQLRLAQLQSNQSLFRLQELAENQNFSKDLNQVVNNNAAFRAASVFSGIYGSQGRLPR